MFILLSSIFAIQSVSNMLFKYGNNLCEQFGFLYILRSKSATFLSLLYVPCLVEERD